MITGGFIFLIVNSFLLPLLAGEKSSVVPTSDLNTKICGDHVKTAGEVKETQQYVSPSQVAYFYFKCISPLPIIEGKS